MGEEISIQHSAEWWKAVAHCIHDGILVIDKHEIVRMINPEYTKITGVTQRIIGKPLSAYRRGAKLPQTLKDGKTRAGVYRKTEDREYMVDMAPIILNGEVVGAVSVCKSLTEVDKLSQELKRQREKVETLKSRMNRAYEAKYTFKDIIGKSDKVKKAISIAEKASASSFPVLITGESGTGKELFAQSIHNKSERSGRAFVPVNCAAIPSSLLESELFGYGEGAFTNAKKNGKPGLFEVAHEGTLFLDEIGDMPSSLQAKLLRVLQEKKLRRVGETKEREIDVRIIAATHRNIEQLVHKKHFREDLFYRLNVIRIEVPPLRERKEDISILIESQASEFTSYIFEEEAVRVLRNYEWPGNIRELKNTVDYATCMADNEQITVENLPSFIVKKGEKNKEESETLQEMIRRREKEYIQKALSTCGRDIEGKKKAAELLGISLATLYNKLKKLNM